MSLRSALFCEGGGLSSEYCVTGPLSSECVFSLYEESWGVCFVCVCVCVVMGRWCARVLEACQLR